MENLINWCGFFGAWLLVAGPLAQGAKELAEEKLERDELVEAAAKVDRPESISIWWWLLPPVYYLKSRQQSNQYKDAVINELSVEAAQSFRSFRDKANGWLAVSMGGLLIATKETWELIHGYEWPEAVFWPLLIFMALIALLNTVMRARRWHEFDGRKNRPL